MKFWTLLEMSSMAESLEDQVNTAYARLAEAKRRKDETQRFFAEMSGRLESPQIRALWLEIRKRETEETEALLEIERLKLVIHARLADAKE
jgi:hypothetical protein